MSTTDPAVDPVLADRAGVYRAADPDQKYLDEWHTDNWQFFYLNTEGKWCDLGWGQPSSMQELEFIAGALSERATQEELEKRLAVARIVAEHWRDAFMSMPGQMGGHGLACVLSALDGEFSPVELGIDPATDVADAIRLVASTGAVPAAEAPGPQGADPWCECGAHRLSTMSHPDWLQFNAWMKAGRPHHWHPASPVPTETNEGTNP